MSKAFFFLAAALLAAKVQASQVTCPKVSPSAWGVGQKHLKEVRVLSYPISVVPGADREYYAAPPWYEREEAGLLIQTWYLNTDVDGFKYEVDCLYAGTTRHVGLDLKGLRACVARWRVERDGRVVAGSLDFSCMQ